jgi:hypothetical protein
VNSTAGRGRDTAVRPCKESEREEHETSEGAVLFRSKCDRGPRGTLDGLPTPQLLTGGGSYMHFQKRKPPETSNVSHRAARRKYERWRSPRPGCVAEFNAMASTIGCTVSAEMSGVRASQQGGFAAEQAALNQRVLSSSPWQQRSDIELAALTGSQSKHGKRVTVHRVAEKKPSRKNTDEQ